MNRTVFQGIFILTVALIISHSPSSGVVGHSHGNNSPDSIFFRGVSNQNQARQEEPTTTEDPINHVNVTLDTSRGLNSTYWTTAQNNLKHYFEYYNDTSDFTNRHDDNGTCSHYVSKDKLDLLSEVNGIWVACKDPGLPSDCNKVSPKAPCSPFINFDHKQSHTPRLRTIKITFAVEELAILRLTVKGSCIDYAKRKDMFSPCGFNEVKDEDTNGGWHLVRFSFYPDENGVFSSFTLKLIARFQHDVVLIDKIETTDYQLCEINEVEVNCPIQPTTPRPTFTTTTSNTTTELSTTTEGPIITDPWEDESTTTTTPGHSAASFPTLNIFFALISFICCNIFN